MIKKLRGLLKKAHVHHWTTTHTNRWQIATRQTCRCGAVRSMHAFKARAGFSDFWWCASTGEVWPEEFHRLLEPKKTEAQALLFAATYADPRPND